MHNCYNTREPAQCTGYSTVNSTYVDPALSMCHDPDGSCVAAYHDCPHKGISSQVDSTGIVIKTEAIHNHIVYAKCLCLGEWSGAGCTEPPPPPPTEEPWPDPYASAAPAAARPRLLAAAAAVLGTLAWLRTEGGFARPRTIYDTCRDS